MSRELLPDGVELLADIGNAGGLAPNLGAVPGRADNGGLTIAESLVR
jgi:hypothetical protein